MRRTWCPSPQYLLRKQCVLRLLRGLSPGRVLEVGCAQGDMLETLGRLGFTGLGVDLSKAAVREAQAHLAGWANRLEVAKAGAELRTGPYDYVMALEVLEHFQDDLDALRQWRQYLKPGGRLVLSVPAHPERWGSLDEAAGHYRRYTRAMIHNRLTRTGFRVQKLWSYGFPIANFTQLLTNLIHRSNLGNIRRVGMLERTARSGMDRSAIRPFRFLWSNPLFRALGTVQILFKQADRGSGYVVCAQKVAMPAETPGRDIRHHSTCASCAASALAHAGRSS